MLLEHTSCSHLGQVGSQESQIILVQEGVPVDSFLPPDYYVERRDKFGESRGWQRERLKGMSPVARGLVLSTIRSWVNSDGYGQDWANNNYSWGASGNNRLLSQSFAEQREQILQLTEADQAAIRDLRNGASVSNTRDLKDLLPEQSLAE